MSVIKIKVDNEMATIMKGTTEEINSGDIKNVSIEFSFSKEWDGYKKTAVIYTGIYDKEKSVRILLSDDRVYGGDIPSSIFKESCYLSVGVFGDNESGQRITAGIVTKKINRGTPTDEEEDIDISLYNQIIRELIILERTSEEIDEKIASGTILLNNTLNSILSQVESAKSNAFDAITSHVTGHMDNLNSVTNVNLSHINSLADGRMQSIETSGNTAVSNINDAMSRALTELDRETTNLINKIVASANDQISGITNIINGHITNINNTANGHINAMAITANAHITNINNVTNTNLTKITNMGEEKLIQIRQEADEIAETVREKAFNVGVEITSADKVKRLEENKLYFILDGRGKTIKVYNMDGEVAFSTPATHIIAMTGTKDRYGMVTAALLYFDPEQNAFVSDYVTAGMEGNDNVRVEVSYTSGSVEVTIGNTV